MFTIRVARLGIGLLGLLALVSMPVLGQPAVVEGQVRDAREGVGVAYANVQLKGTTTGTAAGTEGRFRFETTRSGSVVLRASAVGYDPVERSIRLQSGDTTTVQVPLRAERVALDEAVVTGETFSTGSPSEATLGSTEAVTTPGASGDLFRALQSFPGVAAPGDGAGLFVRGGDVTETKTLLDQAPLHHPFQFESPTGGSFGAVRPFLLDGTQFSRGGFSAQYGDALSGVLAMESKNRPQQARRHFNLGLAAASVSVDQPLIEDELGLRLSGNRSFTGVLFRVNGRHDDFQTVPQGVDGNVSLTWDYDETGQLKLFSFARRNQIGVRTTDGTFSGVFESRETNQLHNLQWTTQTGRWMLESSASWSSFTSERSFGALDLSPTNASGTVRVDATQTADDWTVRTGGTAERRRFQFDGVFPTQPDVVGPDAPTRSVDESLLAARTGGYAEVESSLLSPLVARIGVRTDHHSLADRPVVDPRVALSWHLTPSTRLRAAWGVYHQFPELQTYSEHVGDNTLGAERAQHVVIGLRHERDDLLLRAEAYHKPYDDLVVRTGPSRFANAGSGFARGIDLFAKYGAFLQTRVNGWASYSVLRSRRTQSRDLGSEVQLERGPAPYDLTHQATLVGKVRVIDQLRVGGTFSYVTGRPFTPVVGTEQLESGPLLPIDGPVGSERLSPHHRLDLQLSYFWPFNENQHVIFYAAINNVLDRSNVVDVTYSPDFSERNRRTTDFVRSVYVGLTLTL